MSDPLAFLNPGDKFPLDSRTWNLVFGAVRRGKLEPTPENQAILRNFNVIWIRNDSGTDYDRFNIFQITDHVYDPASKLDLFKNEFAFIGTDDDGENDRIATALVPIKNGKGGWAQVGGVTPVQIDVVAETDRFARHTGDRTKLLSGTTGVPIVTKETGTGTKWGTVKLEYSNIVPGGSSSSTCELGPNANYFGIVVSDATDTVGGFQSHQANVYDHVGAFIATVEAFNWTSCQLANGDVVAVDTDHKCRARLTPDPCAMIGSCCFPPSADGPPSEPSSTSEPTPCLDCFTDGQWVPVSHGLTKTFEISQSETTSDVDDEITFEVTIRDQVGWFGARFGSFTASDLFMCVGTSANVQCLTLGAPANKDTAVLGYVAGPEDVTFSFTVRQKTACDAAVNRWLSIHSEPFQPQPEWWQSFNNSYAEYQFWQCCPASSQASGG